MFRLPRGVSPEYDSIMEAADQREVGFYPDEVGQDGRSETAKATSSDTPWTLIDGIKWNQERLIQVNNVPLIRLGIHDPGSSSMFTMPADTNAINRVLVRLLPDGALRELMIDFTPPYLEQQNPAGTVAHECPTCKRVRAILAGWGR